jgi:hypothetical protein
VGSLSAVHEGGRERADPADRLALARGLLAEAERRPTVAVEPDGRVLPVVPELAGLLPAGGLRRGSTVALPERAGATSLLFALLAQASAEGSWTAVVGRPELGLVAAAEAGLALDRLALVPTAGIDLMPVTVALLDGMDVVVVPGAGIRAGDRQRLAARARQRESVLVAMGPWPGADIELRCTEGEWTGLGRGEGRLRARPTRVHLEGRGIAARGRSARVLLPGPHGRIHGRAARSAPTTARAAG